MQKPRLSPPLVASLLLMILLLAACGKNASSTPQSTSNATPSPNSQGNTNMQVTLTTDKTQYQSRDSITVTIKNNLTHIIYVNARYYNCSPVQVEKQSATGWIPLGHCTRIQANAPMRLQAGAQITQQLPPGAGDTHPVANAAWAPGTYRVSFSYHANYDPDTVGGGTPVLSSTFSIG